METQQEKFWQSSFGQDYTRRNLYINPAALDNFYKKRLGVSRSEMNKNFLRGLKIKNILEAGCNTGNQLILLQKQGYNNLYGFDIQRDTVEMAKQYSKGINIIEGSIFDVPFKSDYFDLVFTSGVLIHIAPKHLKCAMQEIYRVSKKYIWGYEYFSEKYQTIEYRGHKDRLWKGNFADIYLKYFPDTQLIKEQKFSSLSNPQEVDTMFLLKKIKK